jgi:hypothetical protein
MYKKRPLVKISGLDKNKRKASIERGFQRN